MRVNQSSFGNGGGISCQNATVTGCQILNNRAKHGGAGVYIAGGSVSNCLIRGNIASGVETGAEGGGVFAIGATITDCRIENNASSNYPGSVGGGVVLLDGGSVLRCTFVGNSNFGGQFSSGSALYCYAGDYAVSGCVFVGNLTSGQGYLLGTLAGDPGASVAIDHCTLIANRAEGSTSGESGPVAGIILAGGGSVSNTVIVANQGAACGGQGTYTCCDLFANSGGDGLCGSDGGGNFSADPQFCTMDPAASVNVTLQSDSPCAPGNHPGGASCGLIGAGPVACGTTAAQRLTWTDVKSLYRR